uniref:Uncharacterized protein n=1 Tax=Arundo donax TaxID=35708 RepID=A0A0A9AVR9_ARUDO
MAAGAGAEQLAARRADGVALGLVGRG